MDRAFDILFSLQRGTSGHGRWVVECLKGSWARLVGEKLAAVCRPTDLRNAVLTIEVIDDAWLGTVNSVQTELKEKLMSVTAGEVKRLKITG